MVLAPRILYGLDETFMLLPYAMGPRRGRLVLRCRALAAFCVCELWGFTGSKSLGAPLVLGELVDAPQPHQAQETIYLCKGSVLDAYKRRGVEWGLRRYRAVSTDLGVVWFEAATASYHVAARTSKYEVSDLLSIIRKEFYGTGSRSGLS